MTTRFVICHPGNLKSPQVFPLEQTLDTWLDERKLREDFSAYEIAREADLNRVPAQVLVEIFNGTREQDRRITKFSDRATAARRVFAILPKVVRSPGTDPTPKAEPAPRKHGQPKSGPCSPARGKRLGVGARMAELLKAGKTTEEVLAAIRAEFPQSRATNHDVSIIRRKHGLQPILKKNQKPVTPDQVH